MGEYFLGAPVVLVWGFELRSVVVDPRDHGVSELSGRRGAETFPGHRHRSTTWFHISGISSPVGTIRRPPTEFRNSLTELFIAHSSIVCVRSTARLSLVGSGEPAYYCA